MGVNDIVKNKPYLAWYVKNPEKLSEESVLEHVLNYGNWQDVQQFIHIMGKEKTAKLFKKTVSGKRSNYPPEIVSFFPAILRAVMHKDILSSDQTGLLSFIKSFSASAKN